MNEAGLQRLVRRMINRVGDGAWVEKGKMGQREEWARWVGYMLAWVYGGWARADRRWR